MNKARLHEMLDDGVEPDGVEEALDAVCAAWKAQADRPDADPALFLAAVRSQLRPAAFKPRYERWSRGSGARRLAKAIQKAY